MTFEDQLKTLIFFHLGELVAIDGSLINATLSMHWADYRKNAKKAKLHLGFDLNYGLPTKVFLTPGKGAERPFVGQILLPGQTGFLDRGLQSHQYFDQWQKQGQFSVCRIRKKTTKTWIKEHTLTPDSIVFHDAMVLLGTPGVNQAKKELRVVGYRVDHVEYWVATNRYALTGGEVATVYKLRWNIETFFAWWKRHLKVYHLIARKEYGLMVQILAGLITNLLLAIYCHDNYNDEVSIKRVRQLSIDMRNQSFAAWNDASPHENSPDQKASGAYANT
jgi:IS4 transposase